jgi:hypothetical protein
MRVLPLALACLFLIGCSSSQSGGTGSALTPATTVSGTASVGAPIAHVFVTLKDATGNFTITRSRQDGTYELNTTGLVPPFLIQVHTSSGYLYSVSADALNSTTINTDVYTDLIARSWYMSQGESIDSAFGNPVALPAPDPASVKIVSGVFLQTVLAWLNRAGIDSSQFNLISTPFIADGTGFDSVLHNSAMNLATGKLTISDGATTQTSTITYTPGTNSLAIGSTSSGPRGSSVNFLSTVVPAQAPVQAALNSIMSTMATFTATINSRGSQLADSDVLPLLTGDALNDGLDRNTYALMLASRFRPPIVANVTYGFVFRRINSLDLASGQADAVFGSTLTRNGVNAPGSPDQDIVFERTGSTWLFGGNHRIAGLSVAQGNSTIIAFIPPTQGLFATAQAPKDSITGVKVTGGGVWNNTPLTKETASITSFFSGTPIVNLDLFSGPDALLTNLMPAGTPVTFTVTPALGAATDYVVLSPALTNETIAFTSPVPTSLANVALDQPFQVSWMEPTTFPVKSASVIGSARSNSGGFACIFTPAPSNTSSGTTGTLVIPSTCNGSPVVRAQISVIVTGANGEVARALLILN